MYINQFLFCAVYFKKQQKNRVIDVIVDRGLWQAFHLYFSIDSDSVPQNEWQCHLEPDYWGVKQFTPSTMMHLNSVLFAHFVFTPSLGRLITFIVSLCLLSPQHPLHETGTNDLLHHRQSTWHLLSWRNWSEPGWVKTWESKNLEKFFTIYIDFCPFLLKVSLCLIKKILTLTYKQWITSLMILFWVLRIAF